MESKSIIIFLWLINSLEESMKDPCYCTHGTRHWEWKANQDTAESVHSLRVPVAGDCEGVPAKEGGNCLEEMAQHIKS